MRPEIQKQFDKSHQKGDFFKKIEYLVLNGYYATMRRLYMVFTMGTLKIQHPSQYTKNKLMVVVEFMVLSRWDTARVPTSREEND